MAAAGSMPDGLPEGAGEIDRGGRTMMNANGRAVRMRTASRRGRTGWSPAVRKTMPS